MDHPLKVYYPYGGKHIITLWWTHNEQNHIAIARSQSAMDIMIRRFMDKYEDCTVKESYEVEIVAPSVKLCIVATDNKLQQEIDNFSNVVAETMFQVWKSGYKLPSLFSLCTKWEYKYPDSTYQSSEEDDVEHFCCKNCHRRIRLTSLTPDQLYNIYHDRWAETDSRKSFNDKSLYSNAEPAGDDEEIWGAYPDFGHHNYGITLSEVRIDNTEPILFYFRKLNTLSILEYQKLQEEKKKQKIEARKLWEKKRMASIKEAENRMIEKVLSIFADP